MLADWARSFGAGVAWCRVTREDTGQSLIERIARGWGLSASSNQGTRSLLAELGDQAGPHVLVLDDVQLLVHSTARTVVEVLARDSPATTALLLGSRRQPDLDLLHIEVSVDPLLLDAEDLRFRSWEVESLFREVYAAPLSPDDAAALARRTGGWAAALHLFHLSTSKQTPAGRHRAIQALAGRNRYASGYLSQQVLIGLGSELSHFMRRTAVFEVLSSARCDALLQQPGSQSLLVELASRDALTTTEDGGKTFRYHEVLRSHLESELEAALGESGMRQWYGRAALILEQEGALVEALRVRARARDWEGVRHLLDRAGWEIAAHQPALTGSLPITMLQDDPWMQLIEGHRLLADGHLSAAAEAARTCRDQLDDARGAGKVRELLAETRAWQRLECPPTMRWYEQVAGALRAMRQGPSAVRSHERPEQDDLARPYLLFLQGRFTAARDALPYASDLVQEGTPAALSLGLIEAPTAWLQDDPGAREIADAVAEQSELAGMGWFVRASRAVIAAANPDQARGRDDLRRVIAQCDARGDPLGAAWAACILGLHAAASPQPEPGPMADAAKRARELGAEVPAAWMTALEALAHAVSDPGSAAGGARRAGDLAQDVGCRGAHAVSMAALAHAEADLGRLLEVEAWCVDAGMSYKPWASQRAPGPVPRAGRSVSVRLFGGFSIDVDGATLELADLRPQARQLLRVLALHAGEPMHRERLAELMWPSQEPEPAIHRLQVAVSALRRALGDDAAEPASTNIIAREGGCYRFRHDESVRIDVRLFHQALEQARAARRVADHAAEVSALEHALDLYVGDLLPEEGPADWIVEERELLRAHAGAAAAALADILAPVDLGAAIVAAERAVGLDGFNDHAWQLLIALHRELGEMAQAERARASYLEVLRELGLEGMGEPDSHGRVQNSTSAMATRRPSSAP